jgi:hypothetical protein
MQGIPTPPSSCFKISYSCCTEDDPSMMGSSLTATTSSLMMFHAWYMTAKWWGPYVEFE